MNLKINKDNLLFPFIIVDDWYSQEEEKFVWNELIYFYGINQFQKAEENCAEDNGITKAKGNRLYYDLIFKDKKYSYINKMLYKVRNKDFHKVIEDVMPIGKIFKHTDFDNTLINYYEHGDEYKSHYDYVTFTMLIFFYKQPKKFSGGDLYFEENNVTVECKHNRMVLFPGYYLHQVKRVMMSDNDFNSMNGRFSITHFIGKLP
jgi:hypothetical protein